MQALLSAALAVLTGIEPNYDGVTFSYSFVDYDVPFHARVRVQTSRELIPSVFYVDDGNLFCLESGASTDLEENSRDRTRTIVSADLPYRVRDIAYAQSLYVLTSEARPRILSSPGNCSDF